MSERGSFVTEYIYCKDCLNAAMSVLIHDSKWLRGVQILAWSGMEELTLPIIAGKIGGSYPTQELIDFEQDIYTQLARLICHPLRIAVLAEDGEHIFTVTPNT